jgi:hypothetical protein
MEKECYRNMESKAVSMSYAVADLNSRGADILLTKLSCVISPGVFPRALLPPL